jgi:hypothetical protein
MVGKVVAGERPGEVPFAAHVEVLRLFLARRDEIVDRIQALLNAQRMSSQYLQDGALLSHHFEDCLFALAPDQSALRGQLKAAHWANGFKPCAMPGMHNDLVDPGEMMVRGFHLWQQTRWPGRNGRGRYAHTLFNSYLLRCLELLSMRLWDAGAGSPGARLAQIQDLLDQLWRGSAADQPVFVRDARWLIPLAQSPTTDELAAYFEVAEHIARTLAEADRIEIGKASVRMAGGHLRSQLRHYILKKGVSLAENSLVLRARSSNALDIALSIQALVPLLRAYELATQRGDADDRIGLADAICQGISADPELLVNRVDLLGPYSMIEHLFIATDHDGCIGYTPVGLRHVQFLEEYETLIRRLSKPLHDDCLQFRPLEGAYSPYGVIYGFSSNLTEHMALKTLQPDAATPFSLEDVFADGDADKLAWVSGWRKLPHVDPEVQRLFDYPQQFAEDIFDRIEHALRSAVADAGANTVVQTGRLFILCAEHPEAASKAEQIPELPVRYVAASDPQFVTEHKAHPCDQGRLLHDRQEGMFLVSYETPGGWVAISKDLLTDILGAGRDVKVSGLPRVAAAVLRLMCPDLIAEGSLPSLRGGGKP